VQVVRIVRVGGSAAENQVLESLLRGAGQTDVRVMGVSEALDAILAREMDLLLLDLIAPSNDVFNLLRAAQPANGKTSRVPVVVTAPPSANDRVQACLQRGAEDYVSTPFDAENALILTRRIELCLQRKHLREFTIRLRAAKPDEGALVELYSSAANKFVPREFLEHLGRHSLTDVRLGDHVQRNMTVFFSDIRDFTRMSEGMTPQENFDFLNSYLRRATPTIRANRGFIDKYIGDAIMALFPREPKDALQAGVTLQHELDIYNAGRRKAGYEPVRIGIGLHCGDLILGTIGEDERMQTTVIADAVNVAARIEGLTKVFKVSLLVGKSVVDKLPSDHGFHLRHLGAVKAKGKTRNVEIYECFDNDPPELRQHKTNSTDLFASAIAEYHEGLFLSAQPKFKRVAEMNPNDTVAVHYRDSCLLAVMKGGDAALSGVGIETK
jgi:two-component system, sensor histidine kinase ChiS